MQLRKAEAFGVLDHHDGRLRHIDADLDHGGRDQKPRLAFREALHGAILVGPAHAAVHEIDGGAEALPQRRAAILGRGEIDASRIPRPAGRPNRPAGPRQARGATAR